MWSIWQLAVRSNDAAVANARCAATELSRARVERHEVELYLAARYAEAQVPAVTAAIPVPAPRVAATR